MNMRTHWNGIRRRLVPCLATWAFCLDGTKSVDPIEFSRMKEGLQTVVTQYVTYQDTVWLMRVGGKSDLHTPFRLPAGPSRPIPAEEEVAGRHLETSKQAIRHAIQQITAGDDRETHLDEAVRDVLTLATEARDPRTIIVFATDGLTDVQGRSLTTDLGTPTTGRRADGIGIVLLFGAPTVDTMQSLHLTRDELYRRVQSAWSGYFAALGARFSARQAIHFTGFDSVDPRR